MASPFRGFALAAAAALVLGGAIAAQAQAPAQAPVRPPVPPGFTPQPERVSLPANWRERLVYYMKQDREDTRQVRYQYANPEALRATRRGRPAPDGTFLLMEVHPAVVDAAGNVVRSPDNRLVAQPAIAGLFVMEKRRGWGASHPAAIRNGDWEYAVFNPDGTRRQVNTTTCFQCHLGRAAQDYSFSLWPHVNGEGSGQRQRRAAR